MHSPRATILLFYVLTLRIIVASAQKCTTAGDCPEFAFCYLKVCRCNEGFRRMDDRCIDIDECSMRNVCSRNALCENQPGGHSCRCKDGFSGNGKECIDVDECNEIGNVCYPTETCQNEQGSYTCFCNGNVCHQAAYCIHDRGKIECVCGLGFVGDGFYCEDVNECVSGTHNCTEGSECLNTYGSFKCSGGFVPRFRWIFFFVVVLASSLTSGQWCS